MATILVDRDLCTRCGICSVICPMSIIDPADENTLPKVMDAKAGMCIQCGHCESYCPTQALLLNIRMDEKVLIPPGAGTLSREDLEVYLKSAGLYAITPKILYQRRQLYGYWTSPATLHQEATVNRCSGLLCMTQKRCRRLPVLPLTG